jgi:hypothetical protein
MNRKRSLISLVVSLALLLSVTGALAQEVGPQSPQAAIGTAFTYQGQLKNASGPVTGSCDFQVSLWDSLANDTGQIGTMQDKSNVVVSNGLFTVQLDFGANAFNGEARWLEIAVRCPAGSGTYATLSPRQPLTPINHDDCANNGPSHEVEWQRVVTGGRCDRLAWRRRHQGRECGLWPSGRWNERRCHSGRRHFDDSTAGEWHLSDRFIDSCGQRRWDGGV